MDEKKLNDEALEGVSGGVDTETREEQEKFRKFVTNFPQKNCLFCGKLGKNCPIGSSISARYEAFNGDPNAVCPDKTP